MATGKRYYYIKVKDSLMTSDAVDFLMSQPDGANYVVLYQMLHLKAANTGGRLQRQIGEVLIPYDVPKIVRDTKWFSADTVKCALTLYMQLGLVYQDENGILVLTDHANMVGSESDYASQKRQQRINRETPAQLPPVDGDMDSAVDIVHTDIRDKILDNREQSIEGNTQLNNPSTTEDSIGKNKESRRFTAPTLEQVAAYCAERQNGIDPERFIDFYTAKGWYVGKNKMKDWKAAIRTWEKRNREDRRPQQESTVDRLRRMKQEGRFDDP